MTFVKWGMAAAIALALSPAARADDQADAQNKMTQARQDAEKEKAEAQKDASEKKADAQKQMSDADREAQQKSAKAEQKADEKISDAKKDEAKSQGRDVRASQDTGASDSSKKAPLSATAKETLKKLHADSEMEVGMARIAKDKAQNDKVKDLADKIQDDHSKMADKTSELARDHNVELAAHEDMAKNRAHVEQMQKMQGAAFDKHYADMMAQEHRKDIAELRKVQPTLHANKADADVAKLVDDALDKLQGHEKLAVEAQTALKTDQRQGRRGSTTRTESSSWPNTAPNSSAGADTATGPHTGADTTTDRNGSQGPATSTTTQSTETTHSSDTKSH